MTAADSTQEAVWGQPLAGLRLGISVTGVVLVLHLQNVGDRPIKVLSHVAAGETHLDWYTLRVEAAGGAVRTLRLLDDRNRSAQVKVDLAPTMSVQHEVDILKWAARPVNGAEPLTEGRYSVSCDYAVAPQAGIWSGDLHAGPVPLRVPASEE